MTLLARHLARDPLDDEARGEQPLPERAEHVHRIAEERQHLIQTDIYNSLISAGPRKRRFSHITPMMSRMPTSSAVPHAVFRAPRAARPVAHGHEAHLIAFAQHQRDEIAVHVIEIGKRQERVAPEHLQAAAGVVRVVAEQRAAHAVAEARGRALAPGVLPLRRVRPRPCRARIAPRRREARDQFRDVGGIVLAVAVERHDELGPAPRARRSAAPGSGRDCAHATRMRSGSSGRSASSSAAVPSLDPSSTKMIS